MSEIYAGVDNGKEQYPDHFDTGTLTENLDEALDIYLDALMEYNFDKDTKTPWDKYFDCEVGSAYQNFFLIGSFYSEEQETNSIGQLTDRVVEAAHLWKELTQSMPTNLLDKYPQDPAILYTKIIDEVGDIFVGSTDIYEEAKKIEL